MTYTFSITSAIWLVVLAALAVAAVFIEKRERKNGQD